MREDKICSKCNPNKAVDVDNGIGFINIPISEFQTVEITRYICCECGYIEQ